MIRNYKHTIGLCFILGLCLAHVSGCALAPQWLRQEARTPIALSKESYSRKAAEFEKQGELRQALFALQVAAWIDPEDIHVLEKIQSVASTIAAAADECYQRGVEYDQKRDFLNARLQFLKVIHLLPDHPKAQHYLRSRLHTAGHATYRVQRGDSFTKIANDIYKDVSKAYIIAYFNDLDPHRPLYIGTLLVLPELSPAQLLPRRDLLVLMDQAQKALNLNRYTEVLSITERIRTQSPGNAQAQLLADTAHFNLAGAHLEKREYQSALERLRQVSPAYRGRDQAMAMAQRQINRQTADQKLQQARNALEDKNYAEAMRISEQVLAGEPSHGFAQVVFDAARYALGKRYLDQGEEPLAIEILSGLDPTYQDTARLLTQAHARLNARAEALYRQGVMHFLNEELELAIETWTTSLTLNPNHPKAGQDIDNARRLLEKWQAMFKTNGSGP
jgi:tetratricopeptide (TPR) repeat protein